MGFLKRSFFFFCAFLAGLFASATPPPGFSNYDGGPLGPDDLEKFANENFSNFEGNNYVGNEWYRYTGDGDDFLNFGGPGDFDTEVAEERTITWTVKNVNAANKSIRFLYRDWESSVTVGTDAPAYSGQIRTALATHEFESTDGTAAVFQAYNVSSTLPSIEETIRFWHDNPTRLIGLRLSSTDATSIDQILTYQRTYPYRDLGSETLMMSKYTDEYAFNGKIVTIKLPKPWIIDNQTDLIIPIVAGATTTFTLILGAELNTGIALAQKAAKAQADYNRMPVAPQPRNIPGRISRQLPGR